MGPRKKMVWLEVSDREMDAILRSRAVSGALRDADRAATAVSRRWKKASTGLERALSALVDAVESLNTGCNIAAAYDGDGLYCFAEQPSRSQDVAHVKRAFLKVRLAYAVFCRLPPEELERSNRTLLNLILLGRVTQGSTNRARP